MLVVTVCRHGGVGGISPPMRVLPHERAKRDKVLGWSNRSIRSNKEFLYSVDESRLRGVGAAFTGTLRECPSPAMWNSLINALIRRLRRSGLELAHIATEWQPRIGQGTGAVPHLHAALYFDPESLVHPRFAEVIGQAKSEGDPRRLAELAGLVAVFHWLEVVRKSGFSAAHEAQHSAPIHDALGWFQYVSKHQARGLSHYQRSPENIPISWRLEGRTPRMWRKVGDWPVQGPLKLGIPDRGWRFYLRRQIRSWRLSKARQALANAVDKFTRMPSDPNALKVAQAKRGLVSARRSGQCPDRKLSEVRGWNEWCPGAVQLRLVRYMQGQGAEILEGDSIPVDRVDRETGEWSLGSRMDWKPWGE